MNSEAGAGCSVVAVWFAVLWNGVLRLLSSLAQAKPRSVGELRLFAVDGLVVFKSNVGGDLCVLRLSFLPGTGRYLFKSSP